MSSGKPCSPMAAFWAYLAFVASAVTLAWVGVLVFGGVHLSACRYFVPVVHHPGVLACSDHPRPIHAP